MRRGRRVLLRAGAVGVAVVLAGGLVVGGAVADEKAAATKTVRLVVDYGDGVEKHFTALAWKEGLSVLEALGLAKGHSRGITFEYKDFGGDLGYLITKIDDLENEGGGSGARNWVYRVNDKLGTEACNRRELQADDVVRWTFEHLKL
jgi:hypothetical protein